jgi:hypothetical protein
VVVGLSQGHGSQSECRRMSAFLLPSVVRGLEMGRFPVQLPIGFIILEVNSELERTPENSLHLKRKNRNTR